MFQTANVISDIAVYPCCIFDGTTSSLTRGECWFAPISQILESCWHNQVKRTKSKITPTIIRSLKSNRDSSCWNTQEPWQGFLFFSE